jgi:hypothetical protein
MRVEDANIVVVISIWRWKFLAKSTLMNTDENSLLTTQLPNISGGAVTCCEAQR